MARRKRRGLPRPEPECRRRPPAFALMGLAAVEVVENDIEAAKAAFRYVATINPGPNGRRAAFSIAALLAASDAGIAPRDSGDPSSGHQERGSIPNSLWGTPDLVP